MDKEGEADQLDLYEDISSVSSSENECAEIVGHLEGEGSSGACSSSGKSRQDKKSKRQLEAAETVKAKKSFVNDKEPSCSNADDSESEHFDNPSPSTSKESGEFVRADFVPNPNFRISPNNRGTRDGQLSGRTSELCDEEVRHILGGNLPERPPPPPPPPVAESPPPLVVIPPPHEPPAPQLFLPQPGENLNPQLDAVHLDFNQLDNALQHVQGHMNNMMQNLGGLQHSVKHLKQNLSQYVAPACEMDRNGLRAGLHDDILQFWKDGQFTDLTIVDDLGSNHKVHKAVLAARSSFFRAQFTNWDKDDKIITVKIVSSAILKIVLEFIYTLNVEGQINNSNVVDLLQAANIYDLRLLREECVHFLQQKINFSNIIEILSFSHIDTKLEQYATDFLARNLSKFLLGPGKKSEVLELPVDKMKMILKSRLLILRDKHMFPYRAVARETAILRFALEYISFRESSRLAHAYELLSSVRFHLLPLDDTLEFKKGRYLPTIIEDFIESKQSKYPQVKVKFEKMNEDVMMLHSLEDKSKLYSHTYSNLDYINYYNNFKDRESKQECLSQRNPIWDAACNREASVCHEWWTAHAHDSRFTYSNIMDNNTTIVAVSGAGGSEKFITKLTFYIGDVNDNHDLLPDWFNLAPQLQPQNLQAELGEYIGCIHVVWSNGKENWIGTPANLHTEKFVIALEAGEHIIKSYQLFWGPRQVFVPLEIVDFVLVTSKGRKFGPFTRQVRKSYFDIAEAEEKDGHWSYTNIRHKLNSKKIERQVDVPLNPMCRPASVNEICNINLNTDDDLNWSLWLDGFLCLVKNEKITRITLKVAVYLDCFYVKCKKKPKFVKDKSLPVEEGPVLLNYTLDDLKKNIKGNPIRIYDYENLWDNMINPYADTADGEQAKRDQVSNLASLFNGPGVAAPEEVIVNAMNAWNGDDEVEVEDEIEQEVAQADEVIEQADQEQEQADFMEEEEFANANGNNNEENLNNNDPDNNDMDNVDQNNPVGGANNDDDDEGDSSNNEANGNEVNVIVDVIDEVNNLVEVIDYSDSENENEDDEEEEEGDNQEAIGPVAGDVWDALINDDLEAIGQLVDARVAIDIDKYLQ